MKPLLFICCFCLITFAAISQTIAGNFSAISEATSKPIINDTHVNSTQSEFKTPTTQTLEPIYFSYKKRQLIYKCQKMRGEKLVAICRNIPDSAIQEQINYYDNLSNNKKWILCSTIVCGASALVLLYSSALFPFEKNAGYIAGSGAAAALASGITAICSSIPHQKRKIIMFKDLPIAYNLYVAKHCHN